jgi:hypothetical protein
MLWPVCHPLDTGKRCVSRRLLGRSYLPSPAPGHRGDRTRGARFGVAWEVHWLSGALSSPNVASRDQQGSNPGKQEARVAFEAPVSSKKGRSTARPRCSTRLASAKAFTAWVWGLASAAGGASWEASPDPEKAAGKRRRSKTTANGTDGGSCRYLSGRPKHIT